MSGGIAIAAMIPIIITTTINSTRVKPACLCSRSFGCVFNFSINYFLIDWFHVYKRLVGCFARSFAGVGLFFRCSREGRYEQVEDAVVRDEAPTELPGGRFSEGDHSVGLDRVLHNV